ncbi:hypothetical protein F0P96_19315 [Hymenobacter busanensis]|uniref:Uncharacterized protein n=1 Tax=Hymenobacter busanensis TaxID=2607656 RepID=A0A7L4ZTW4_9BACT|nr:hypothetical protein [Hymenobacter busanensis]KAA9325915.1 hypothetical protein F0P96_19315 [Hymenobacter busanensis]QHJ06246.1 hypothetical protein GUY19_02610 [Hymenobacter busanensis]
MTRASLLQVLDHVTGISEAEVRELEQLATAFPYCQTAHLLLAKAAHDRGSMLAGQRLRRAATYAADRELLRALIEQPAPSATPTSWQAADSLPVATPTAEPEAATTPAGNSFAVSAAAVALEPAQEQAPEAADLPAGTVDASPSPEAAPVLEEATAAAEPAGVVESAESETEPDEPAAAPAMADAEAQPAAEPAVDPSEAVPVDSSSALATAAEAWVAVSLDDDAGPAASEPDAEPTIPEPAPPVTDELPPVAPAIRPPVEVGSSRFEFGLAESLPPVTAYQLPDALESEAALPAVPAFYGDEDVAYSLAGGSRLGICLVPQAAELTHELPVANAWEPDALLLGHAAQHRPNTRQAPSSLALIERFLRTQPRIKAGTPRPATAVEPQADLSVRSTSTAPSLATESLAKILIKQGKTARAIEIYEQLMVRQPEKKAYFAAQIDLLNQQPE